MSSPAIKSRSCDRDASGLHDCHWRAFVAIVRHVSTSHAQSFKPLSLMLALGFLMVSCQSVPKTAGAHDHDIVLTTPKDRDRHQESLEVKIVEVPRAMVKSCGVLFSSTAGSGSCVVDAKSQSLMLRKMLASGHAKTTSYPRMVTRDYREVTIRSVVNIPFTDAEGKAQSVPAGLCMTLLPHRQAHDQIRLKVGITDSAQTGRTMVKGHPCPVIESHVFNQSFDLPPGSSAAIAMPCARKDGKNRAMVFLVTPGLD